MPQIDFLHSGQTVILRLHNIGEKVKQRLAANLAVLKNIQSINVDARTDELVLALNDGSSTSWWEQTYPLVCTVIAKADRSIEIKADNPALLRALDLLPRMTPGDLRHLVREAQNAMRG